MKNPAANPDPISHTPGGIPACVQNALTQWDELVFTAYDWYVKHGRVSVAIEPDGNDPAGALLSGHCFDERLRGALPPDAARLLDIYDPDHEIVIQFSDTSGCLRTQRLRTAPGARSPRRVWLFETVRRLEEEPQRVDPALPRSFVGLLDLLERLKRDREGENSETGCARRQLP